MATKEPQSSESLPVTIFITRLRLKCCVSPGPQSTHAPGHEFPVLSWEAWPLSALAELRSRRCSGKSLFTMASFLADTDVSFPPRPQFAAGPALPGRASQQWLTFQSCACCQKPGRGDFNRFRVLNAIFFSMTFTYLPFCFLV